MLDIINDLTGSNRFPISDSCLAIGVSKKRMVKYLLNKRKGVFKMRLKKILSMVVSAALVLSAVPAYAMAQTTEAKEIQSDVLFDDFSGDSLDKDKWLVAHKRWGGNNSGVIQENVSLSDGLLKLEGHGLNYTGDVIGIGRDDGKLAGAAIATRDYYASGSYEVRAKIAPDLGACSALWTFEYEEYYPGQDGYVPELATWGYCTVNHEIDIEIPTAVRNGEEPNFHSARFNTYERENAYNPHYQDLGFDLDDGKFHTYRFDWHTGDVNETPRVDFYIDDQYMYSSYKNIPTNESRFWMAVWFPYAKDSDGDGKEDTGWAGLADFDTTVFEIDSVKITPFHEAGDTKHNETYGYDGWAENSFPEIAEQENFEHIVNGDFAKGEEACTLSNNAAVSGEKAHLASGQIADKVEQKVNVVPAGTYTITADVVTDGTEVRIGACKENGSKDQYISTTKSGKVSITFNNESVNTTLKVYAMVDRWQGQNVKVTVDNISMYATEYVKEPVKEFIPSGDQPETEPDVPTKPEEPEIPVSVNLIKNGSFVKAQEDWKLGGSAAVADKKAILASGSDTDSISQKVDVEKGTTYTLSADITTPGAELAFGVKDYDGRYTRCDKTVTKSGHYDLTFTTASHIDNIEVFAEVLRYQNCKDDCSITNISLVKGTTGAISPEEPPVEPEKPAEENLLVNASLTSEEGWDLSGNARIENGMALLDSGSDTDKMTQMIALESYTTYRFSADIVSAGADVDLKVSGFDGKYNSKTETFNNSGEGFVEFTTGSFAKEVKVTIQVLRYQDCKEDNQIKSVKLVKVN